MADTAFTPNVTPIVSTWTQDINNTVYRLLGDSSGAGGTGGAPLTRADIIANMGLLTSVAAASTYETIAGSAAIQVGYKNRLLNAAMQIDQTNRGAAQSIPAATPTYVVDMWAVNATGAGVTGQQVAGTSTPYMYQLTGAVGVTGIDLYERIESANIRDLAGKTVTLSVKLANSLLTTVSWEASYANAVDNFAAVTSIATGNFTVSATEGTYSAQIALPAGAANGVQIKFSVGAQTSGTWDTTSVQLEDGSVPTSFEIREIGQEQLMCLRYFMRMYGDAIGNSLGFVGAAAAATTSFLSWNYPVEMRAAPTLTLSNTNVANGVAGFPVTSYSLAGISTRSVALSAVASSATFTGGQCVYLYAPAATSYIQFDARL